MKELIKKIVESAYLSKEGHIASSLSILDLLCVLYGEVLDLESIKNNLVDRDRFILSKGHASLGLYATLKHFGLLDFELNDFCKFHSILGGHPSDKIPYVESSTGSLGHGLPIGVGMALGYKIKDFKHNVYVIIGDGESNEGTIWESALLASHHNLNNLCCIMDHNRSGDRAVNIDNVIDKFKSFNWECIEVDGHNVEEIKSAINSETTKPKFVLANTIKGKGCDIMENKPEWHHKFPNDEEYLEIMKKLD